jgi:hypothetical protein
LTWIVEVAASPCQEGTPTMSKPHHCPSYRAFSAFACAFVALATSAALAQESHFDSLANAPFLEN